MPNPLHEANRRHWDAASASYAARKEMRGLWQRCAREPHLALSKEELRHLGDVRGRRVCVLGSGDNHAVFALAGLGADVTSVDISQAQLDVARQRAEQQGLGITFVRADVTDLAVLKDEGFDLIYTGGHVAVWVADLNRYYSEAARILRAGGLLVVSEYHPFRRIWKGGEKTLEIERSYFDRGPHEYDTSGDWNDPSPGPYKTYEFHWTVSDYIAAVRASGCELVAVEEFGDEAEDWEHAPLRGLPRMLLVVGRKDGNGAP